MNNRTVTETYDAVFVCTGFASSPLIPDIKDAEKFNGEKIHSHDYRRAEAFQGLYINCTVYNRHSFKYFFFLSKTLTLKQRRRSSGNWRRCKWKRHCTTNRKNSKASYFQPA